jgi:tight adherence protein B
VPLFLVGKIRARRLAKLTDQLPEALDTMVRTLRAGHPVPACIALVATDMPAPLGEEFKRVHDAMVFGLSLKDALERMTDRLDSLQELKYVAAAIRIQGITGGNLSEVLASLAHVMRERQKLLLKVKALSSEGRISGNILAALPVVVGAAIIYIRQDLFAVARPGNGLFTVLIIAAVQIVVGYGLVRHFANIKV